MTNLYRKILTMTFPERDFAGLKKMNGRGKGRTFIAGGYCYKVFPHRHAAIARREAAMAQILRGHLDRIEVPDIRLVDSACGKGVILHYRLLEGEISAYFVQRATLAQRMQLADDLGELLARIHTLDLNSLPPELISAITPLPRKVVRAWQLRRAKVLVERRYRALLDDRVLFLEEGALYDHSHLIHGDFHRFNLLTRDGRLSGMIDFGCCEISACSYLDFRKIMYRMDRPFEERLLARYAEVAGVEVDVRRVAAGLVARLCIANRWVPLPLWNPLARQRLRWAMRRFSEFEVRN